MTMIQKALTILSQMIDTQHSRQVMHEDIPLDPILPPLPPPVQILVSQTTRFISHDQVDVAPPITMLILVTINENPRMVKQIAYID